MKKLLITTAAVLAVSGAAFAQGTVQWGTLTPTVANAATNSTVASTFAPGGPLVGTTTGATGIGGPGGASFYYALLYTAYSGSQAAVPTTMGQLTTAGWQSAGLLATNGTIAGRMSSVGPNNGSGATVPWANGTTSSVMLVGWSAGLGNTWALASANLINWQALGAGIVAANGVQFFGTSATGYINPGSANPGVAIFANPTTQPQGLAINAAGTQLYELTVVPEPGTLALAALGGASLLLFRRRK